MVYAQWLNAVNIAGTNLWARSVTFDGVWTCIIFTAVDYSVALNKQRVPFLQRYVNEVRTRTCMAPGKKKKMIINTRFRQKSRRTIRAIRKIAGSPVTRGPVSAAEELDVAYFSSFAAKLSNFVRPLLRDVIFEIVWTSRDGSGVPARGWKANDGRRSAGCACVRAVFFFPP